MKKFFLAGILVVLGFSGELKAQDTLVTTDVDADTAVYEPATEQGKNLDLAAVLEVFRESEGLEDFENKLNQKDGINNIDLNGDSIVDYIRVLEKEEGEYRVVVLQSIVGKNEFQDVAFINIKKSEDNIEVQAEGSKVIYGEDYYVSPKPTVHININLWSVWGYMYRPGYHYYHSPYYWGYYPPHWQPYPPFPYHYYHGHVSHYHHGYHHGHRPRISRPPTIYSPRNSNMIKTTPVQRPGNRPIQQGGKPGAPATKPAQKPSAKPSQKPATRPSTKPATPPAGKPATRPSPKPSQKPATRPSTKPSQKPATRPSTKPSQKPATRPATKPSQRPATKPSTRPSQKPATRPSTPQRRPAARPATPPRQRPAARPPARMPKRR
jgi:hypothetical protein